MQKGQDMNLEKARQDFAKIQKNISSIDYAIDLLIFDGETAAPPNSASNRIFTLEIMNDELYSMKFGEEMAEIVECLKENESELNLVEKRSLTLLMREMDRIKRISKEEYAKYQSLTATTANAWHQANEADDYELLRPHLEGLFESARKFGKSANPEISPYEYFLNIHEPGSSTEAYDAVFDNVRQNIVPLLKQIQERPQVDSSCLIGDYSAKKQEELAFYIMELMGLNMDNVGLATSAHPFIREIGSHFDERITTRYSRRDFTFSLYTILFSCGCALAGQGQDDDVAYTYADGSGSIGLLEGQTRFYEHIIGRSKPFINYIYPKLKALFPTSIKDSTPEDLYLAINKVEAGPIRAGSDEVTNNLHVLVRYELEKALMSGDLSCKDLPDAWAEKYMEYLGVKVENPTQGILQDILWADGIIGYFPTGVLGNVYSALTLDRLSRDVDFESCVSKGDFASINEWNRERVWRHMGLYDGKEVMEKFLGISSLDGSRYVEYLKNKYSEIYKF